MQRESEDDATDQESRVRREGAIASKGVADCMYSKIGSESEGECGCK